MLALLFQTIHRPVSKEGNFKGCFFLKNNPLQICYSRTRLTRRTEYKLQCTRVSYSGCIKLKSYLVYYIRFPRLNKHFRTTKNYQLLELPMFQKCFEYTKLTCSAIYEQETAKLPPPVVNSSDVCTGTGLLFTAVLFSAVKRLRSEFSHSFPRSTEVE